MQLLKTQSLEVAIILKIKFVFLFFILIFSTFCWPQVDANSKELNTLREYGVYPLEDVTLNRLQKEKTLPASEEEKQQLSLKEIVVKLIDQNDEEIIKRLAQEINPQYINKTNLNFLKEKVLEIINPPKNSSTPTSTSNKSAIEEKKLFESQKSTGVVLKKTDIIELKEIKVGDKSHQTVTLEGNVQIDYENGSIEGNKIIINLDTREISGRGKIKVTIGDNVIEGDEILFKLNEEQGYVNNASGLQQGNYFRVKTFRINSREHFTLEDGWVTFSKNDDPFYHVHFGKVDIYGTEREIFKNIIPKVHNHGFFWFPYFNRYPLSSSLDLSFGETRREGLYFLTKTSFDNVPLLTKIALTFNVYEKLGYYLNVLNQNTIANSDYKLDFTGVYYSRNDVTKEENKLTYSHNIDSHINSQDRLSYKIRYDHNFSLAKKPESNITSDLKFSMNNTNDPLLSSIFSRNLTLDHLDIQRLIERHDRDEDIFRFPTNPSDTDYYKINYSLSAPDTSLTVDLSWLYGIYDDPNKKDDKPEERYNKYLRSVTLPSIKFSHSGTFDPNADNSLLHFNIPYSLGVNYTATSQYKDGTPINSGSGNSTGIEAYALEKENYSLNLNGSISRPFSFDKDEYSFLNFGLDWYSWTIDPSLSVNYSRNWEGKNYTTENSQDKDKTILRLSYAVKSNMDFFNSIPNFIGFNLQNNWSLTDERTTLLFDENSVTPREETQKIASNYKFSMPIDFPSNRLKNIWKSSNGFESMLPVFDLDFNYNLAKRTSPDRVDSNPLLLDLIDRRDFSINLKGAHSGYGFLYIPYLNYTLASSVGVAYDLLPIKDDDGNVTSTDFLSDSNFWREDRIKSFSGSTSWNFNLNISPVRNTLNNSLSYDFFDKTEKIIKPELVKYGLSYNFSLSPVDKNNIFDLDSFSFGYKFNYFFREEQYTSDSMSFTLGTKLRILNLFNINISFTASNPDSYLYFKDKANHLNKKQVNFFDDIFNSLGFGGVNNQRDSLFKLSKIKLSIVHDIDDWQASFSYSFLPVSFTEDSFRGFYLDHVISFNINLKPERDPRGPEVARADPFFEEIERDFTPTGL